MTRITRPPPSRGSALTWPPCARTTERTIDSPSPTPLSLPVRSERSLRKGSKMFSSSYAGTTGPVFETTRDAPPSHCPVEISTGQWEGGASLVVSNTGPVVPAYELENIFEPFRRLRSERTGSDKGVGLGLSIVRSVVRAHGGHVSAEPREGGGLVMRVTLPV